MVNSIYDDVTTRRHIVPLEKLLIGKILNIRGYLEKKDAQQGNRI